ncbi:lytic transglycosylase domain-containing protein [Haloechinothrix halophila]|uniref:lytic transglycosylase domain-containing protein n=1 Tax=Haloechinothrix halophila TaxID=1069073 RepID=UPI0004073E4B|nr:lytic murein transglycosylase [Haloechinothrix halophila]
MAGRVTRVVDLIVRTIRSGIREVESLPPLDLKRGLHLTMAGLLLLTNAGYAAPIAAVPFGAVAAHAPYGADGGTALFLQPPPLPTNTEAVVVVSALPRGSTGKAPAIDGLGIPRSALRAYRAAEKHSNATDPRCGMSVALLAAIGRVESGHARGGNVNSAGTTLQPILGPRLDGGPGIAAIGDTDNGRYDGDTVWDRAVGPMQFIPSTWAGWAADGNGDGVADPHNIYDSTVASANYLCAGDRDLRQAGDLRAAILSYNYSTRYLEIVLAWLDVYSGKAVAIPDVRAGAATQVAQKTTANNDRKRDRDHVQAAPPRPRQQQSQPSSGTSEPLRKAAPAERPDQTKPTKHKAPVPDEPDPVKAVRDNAEKPTNADMISRVLDIER